MSTSQWGTDEEASVGKTLWERRASKEERSSSSSSSFLLILSLDAKKSHVVEATGLILTSVTAVFALKILRSEAGAGFVWSLTTLQQAE